MSDILQRMELDTRGGWGGGGGVSHDLLFCNGICVVLLVGV